MTNKETIPPSASELLALADRYEIGTAKCIATGYAEYGPDFRHERRLVVEALRALASRQAEPVAWCQPMDRGKHTPRKFMIYFDDPDHGIMTFDNEAEARSAFAKKNTAWSCYLFGTLPLNPIAQPATDAVREALECAVDIIMSSEPGHSCAVSDIAVALAAVSSGDTSDQVMAVVRAYSAQRGGTSSDGPAQLSAHRGESADEQERPRGPSDPIPSDPVSVEQKLALVRLGARAMRRAAEADCGNHSEGAMEDAMTSAGLTKSDRSKLAAECDAADAIRKQIAETCEDSALGYGSYILSDEDQAVLKALGVTSDWLYRKENNSPSRAELARSSSATR